MSTPAINTTRSLTESECWHLLRSVTVGRLAVVIDGVPDIFPVNFVVDGGTVVFRTALGTKVAALAGGAPIAFEVDGHDTAVREAWSVVTRGTAMQIRSIDELVSTAYLPLAPLNSEPKGLFIRITPTAVAGRRFPVADPSAWQNVLHGS